MGRPPKKPADRYSHDLRAKVVKDIFDAVQDEADFRRVDRSVIVREAVIAHLSNLRALESVADQVADQVAEAKKDRSPCS